MGGYMLKERLEAEFRRIGCKTLEQMGEKVGVTPEYIGQIFNGKRVPTDPYVFQFCRAIGLGPDKTKEFLLLAAVDRNKGEVSNLWSEISARLSSSQPPAPTETRPLDPDLLIESIKLAQMFADISDEETSPERSARIISLLYETQLENRNITRSQLLKLVVNNT